MSIEARDELNRPIPLVAPRPRRAKSDEPAETPPDKPIDAKTTKTEIQRSLCTIYNISHKIIRDEVRFSPADFGEEADGLIELMNQHAALRIILRVLTPIAAVASLVEKVRDTVERFQIRRRSQQQDEQLREQLIQQSSPNEAANIGVDVAVGNGTVESPKIDRGFFTRTPLG